MSKKMSKVLIVIKTFFTWFVSIASLVLGILALVGADSFNNTIIYILIVVNSLVLVVLGICILAQFVITDTGSLAIANMKSQMKQQKRTIKNFSDNYSFLSGVLCDFTHRITEINVNYFNKLDYLEDLNQNMISNGVPKDEVEKQLVEFKKEYDKDHGKTMMEQYDRFLSHITFRTQELIESYLLSEGIDLKASISIKQFKEPISHNDSSNFNTPYVYTSYRDSRTWKEKIRSELGHNLYTISKNTDFIQCMNSGISIFNNKSQDDTDFENESKYYLEHYNSGATALITMKMREGFESFGFITCDVNNLKYKRAIIDDNIAKILSNAAIIVAFYFDNLAYNWDFYGIDSSSDSFWEYLYINHYKSKE